jgi:hypothetical protein
MPYPPLVRRHVGKFIAGVVLFAAIGATAGQAREAIRVRATVDTVDGNSLRLTTRTGDKMTASLAPDVAVVEIVPVRLEDIKQGSFIGAAAMPQPDGTQRALEVHVFPESMRGTGEGYRPFDLRPQSTMTNGTVGALTGTVGRTLTVTYQGGKQSIIVPPDTPVVTFEPGSPALLVPNAHVIVMGRRTPDGTMTATRISVGKDGLVPPM